LYITLFFFLFLICVAYVTLLERHLLALRQLRLGPNKRGFIGLLQPFIDALKLFQKSVVLPAFANPWYFWIAPSALFGLLFWQTAVFQSVCSPWSLDNSLLYLMCIVGLTVYSQFALGFFTTSKYRYLASLRTMAQRVSYEVPFFFYLFAIILSRGSYGGFVAGGLYLLLLSVGFVILMLIELGRAPFDFSEAERELVSGYNLEYGGVLFLILFLSEYGLLLRFSLVLSRLLLS
jgi:NADH:ubiquinone oxidoreductase subunit H